MDYKAIRKSRSISLKQLRIEAGLTQIELGKLANLSQMTIRTMEHSSKSWNVDSEIIFIEACNEHLKQKYASGNP